MLRALGVKSENALQSLVNYFFRDTAPETAFGAPKPAPPLDGTTGQEEWASDVVDQDELMLHNPPEDVAELKSIISAESVIQAVKAYIEDVTVDSGAGKAGAEEDARIGQKRLNR